MSDARYFQQGNPVLTLVKSVQWEFGETISDYQLNSTTGALFLSLKYHRLHPDYLDTRIKKLHKAYDLKILLCLCDAMDHEMVLKDITKVSSFPILLPPLQAISVSTKKKNKK
jgi:DNA excision repair protein ERCC-1